MNRVEQYLADRLEERMLAGNLRRLTTTRAETDFFSNDYLGLVTTGALAMLMHPYSFDANDTGATGSRLLSGNSEQAEALENNIATFHKAKAALLFNSGYDANVGLITSITSRNTTILSDELCHASLIDGIRLSQCARRYKFAHNDLNDLAEKLKKYRDAGPVLVVVESIYSMDGDMAPLSAIAALCSQNDAQLIVDEAHATGVTGVHGEGMVCALGLEESVFARVHTFGKAMGCHGAAIVGSNLLKQYLINFSRTFIYTTALPPHAVHSISCAYKHLSHPDFTNEPIHELIAYFRKKIRITGIAGWKDSVSPIQAFITGNNANSKKIAAALQVAGLQVNPILSPTVANGQERLRICLHTFNTNEQVDRLFDIIGKH